MSLDRDKEITSTLRRLNKLERAVWEQIDAVTAIENKHAFFKLLNDVISLRIRTVDAIQPTQTGPEL